MAGLGDLVVRLSAETAQFTQALDKATYQTQKNFQSMQSSAKTLAGALGLYLSADLFVGFVKGQIDVQDALFKTSQKIGISVEDLSKLSYAAKLADVDAKQLQTGLVKLSKGMVEASNGTGDVYKGLSAMGVAVKNSDGTLKSSSQVLGEIADKFEMYEDGANKTALAVQFFGKSGADLIPLLNGGSKAIKQAGDELERFGGVVKEKAAREAEAFNDNLTRLGTLASVVGKDIANGITPYLNQLAEEFIVARKNGIGFMDMLAMGTRFGDYQKQLQEVEKEIVAVQKAWAFPLGASRDERLEALNRQKKTLTDLMKLREEQKAKDNMMGPPSSAMAKGQAPTPVDDDVLKALSKSIELTNKYSASMGEMIAKRQLAMRTPFMSAEEIKLQEDIIAIQKSFTDAQASLIKLRQEGKLSDSAYTEQAQKLGKVYEETILKTQELTAKQVELNSSWEYGASVALAKYGQEAKNTAKLTEGVVGRALDSLDDSLYGIITRTTSVSDAFRNMANSIIQDIARIMIRQQVSAPLAQALGSLGSVAMGNFYQGQTGITVDDNGVSLMVGSGKALGGSVKGGTSYLVGEKGAEVFTPAMSGTITPNSSLGGETVVNQTINIQTGVAQTVRTEIQSMMPRIMEATKAAVAESKLRGGTYGRMMS